MPGVEERPFCNSNNVKHKIPCHARRYCLCENKSRLSQFGLTGIQGKKNGQVEEIGVLDFSSRRRTRTLCAFSTLIHRGLKV